METAGWTGWGVPFLDRGAFSQILRSRTKLGSADSIGVQAPERLLRRETIDLDLSLMGIWNQPFYGDDFLGGNGINGIWYVWWDMGQIWVSLKMHVQFIAV